MPSASDDFQSFAALQHQLKKCWQDDEELETGNQDILVIPSFSIDQQVGQNVPGFLHYEERLLFSLIRLRNPLTRLIYVTAQPLAPLIIDYYLQLLSGIPFSHARDRLLLITTYDTSYKPLTKKILDRPRLVAKIRRALRPNQSFMVCYNATELEKELSEKLQVPLFAASPDVSHWGSKSGSRQAFELAEIPFPDGSHLVKTVPDLVEVTASLWHRKPELQRIVIKLNEGFSGEGNAVLDLRPLPPVSTLTERQTLIAKALPEMNFQAATETWEHFASRIPELGAIAEAFIEGETKRSPSVQGLILPSGKVEILSTHDQILGGQDGQIYLGCTFPAAAEYRLQLQILGLKVGEILAAKGAMERFGVDFIATQQPDKSWDLQAIEINLRKGGTTHPLMTLKLLTNGEYDYQSGLFFTPQGQEKYYIASDNLQKNQYQGLLPSDLMDIIAAHGLHFDSSTKTGTVFHLMGTLSQHGKLGLTSIGNSLAEAEAHYQRVEEVLDLETSGYYATSSHLPLTW
ncbi:hypothetical protein Lepto7376_0447 [[Leptolyngbya] sp. PCC 7376]|uniref:peptide ligase PGM1-related protein n=1 Tax=[Leptolyngbya] sp. PCC 7376 TaxID=111781 RepID=UPI00029EFE55|nr:peptide ligase PGM1-related protein [[Leptolyngbya] sp. PCC 7376]AFY36882.1 hypothetical protein Lepto7376_0447 [[Leptolyngbya] sp. PCC 7376]